MYEGVLVVLEGVSMPRGWLSLLVDPHTPLPVLLFFFFSSSRICRARVFVSVPGAAGMPKAETLFISVYVWFIELRIDSSRGEVCLISVSHTAIRPPFLQFGQQQPSGNRSV